MTQTDDKEGVREEGALVKKRGKRNFFFFKKWDEGPRDARYVFLMVNQSLLYNKKSNTVHNNNIQRLNEENVNTENNENFV